MKCNRYNPEWLLIGLGNVGKRYANNRHNFGFTAVERFVQDRCGRRWKKRPIYYYIFCERNSILAAKPRTMMNLSGIAAAKLLEKYRIPPERIVVVYDDLDLPLGSIRIRKRGSHGGHKGIKSIIASVGSDNFPRARLGIGNAGEEKPVDAAEYVLSDFSDAEREISSDVLSKACNAIELITDGRIEKAMNRFN